MALPRAGGRRRYTLVLLVLTGITLLTLDFRGFGPLETAQDAVRSALNPLRSLTATITDPIADAWNGIVDYDDLQDENAALLERLGEIESNAVTEESARAQLEALQEQLDLDFLAGGERVVARVVAGATGNFSPFSVEIDKGSNHGLIEGQAVVVSAGLAGRIVQVDRNRSVVQLISDPEFTVAVRLSGSQDVGIGRGNGDDQRTLIVEEGIEVDTQVRLGEAVTTAGGRSRFPAGIPVGLVTDVEAADNQLEQRVFVTLGADVDNLDIVTVIVSAPPEASVDDPDAVPTSTTVEATEAPS